MAVACAEDEETFGVAFPVEVAFAVPVPDGKPPIVAEVDRVLGVLCGSMGDVESGTGT
jgi:hypothetical protein